MQNEHFNTGLNLGLIIAFIASFFVSAIIFISIKQNMPKNIELLEAPFKEIHCDKVKCLYRSNNNKYFILYVDTTSRKFNKIRF
jgi:hypothetical protein